MKVLYAVYCTFADLRMNLKRVGLSTFPDLTADATKQRNRGQRCAFVWGPRSAVGAQPGSRRPALPFTVSPCVVCVRRTCREGSRCRRSIAAYHGVSAHAMRAVQLTRSPCLQSRTRR